MYFRDRFVLALLLFSLINEAVRYHDGSLGMTWTLITAHMLYYRPRLYRVEKFLDREAIIFAVYPRYLRWLNCSETITEILTALAQRHLDAENAAGFFKEASNFSYYISPFYPYMKILEVIVNVYSEIYKEKDKLAKTGQILKNSIQCIFDSCFFDYHSNVDGVISAKIAPHLKALIQHGKSDEADGADAAEEIFSILFWDPDVQDEIRKLFPTDWVPIDPPDEYGLHHPDLHWLSFVSGVLAEPDV